MLGGSAAAAEAEQLEQEDKEKAEVEERRRRRMQLSNETVGCSSACVLEPPPDMILRVPPPPLPGFLVHTSSNYYTTAVGAARGSGAEGVGAVAVESAGSGGDTDADNEDVSLLEHFRPCKYSCSGEWRITDEGLHHVEIPQQGSIFEDTWLLILVCASVGVIFIGIILATLMIRCKLNQNVDQTNDGASQCSNRSNKNSTLSTSTASSSIQTTTTTSGSGIGCTSSGASSTMGISGTYIINNKSIVRLQNEAILYPCPDALQDSRVMWATLTPRGTTRHYLEEHTYETIGGLGEHHLPPPPPPPPLPTYAEVGYLQHQPPPPHRRTYSDSQRSEHVNLKTYHDPPAPSPIVSRHKDEKAFDNTAFVDYEDPLSLKNEYYQLEDVLEPCDQIFSVQGLYGLPPSTGGGATTAGLTQAPGAGGAGGGLPTAVGVQHQHHQQHHPQQQQQQQQQQSRAGTLVRPRVSTPTRIEHPNLPPLNQRSIKLRKSQHHHTLGSTRGSSSASTNAAGNLSAANSNVPTTTNTTSSYVPTI